MSTSATRPGLANFAFGKARRAVLSLLFSRGNEDFYLRQIVRLTGLGLGPVQRELTQLARIGIAARMARGRRVYYRANPDSPVYAELTALFSAGKRDVKAGALPADEHRRLETRPFPVPGRLLADFSRRHHIKRLSIFGSALRDDFRAESDIDILVEFEEGKVPGMFALAAMERELSALVWQKSGPAHPSGAEPLLQGRSSERSHGAV